MIVGWPVAAQPDPNAPGGVPMRAPPPSVQLGPLRATTTWLHRNLFSSISNGLLTILAVAGFVELVVPFLRWAVFGATVHGTSQAACTGDGACWTFIRLRLPTLLYGHYPVGQTWRVDLAALLLAVFCVPVLRLRTRRRGRWLVLLLTLYPALACWLLLGGVSPLPYADPDLWGGLMLNVIITVLVTTLAMPVGILLALGRQSPLPVIRGFSVWYIEFWRGLPLLGVLFVSAVMAHLFLPQGVSVSRLLRAVAAMSLFNAAYFAEIVRGGLQSVAAGQYEAAVSIGLRSWQVNLLIILPQALRQAIPGLVNTVIDLFKDTTLISIIGLFDLLGSVSQALRDPAWLGLAKEGFTFAALVFFACCFAISLYSRGVERKLAHRRPGH
jgi:general L-amino acid transport system permease protein